MHLCVFCGKETKNIKDFVEFESKTIGLFVVPNVEITKCLHCKNTKITDKGANTVIEYVDKLEKQAIGQLPISEFISISEAAVILELTIQQFRNLLKIKNHMIFKQKIGQQTFYHKKSIELFKKNKDGRFFIEVNSKWVIE